MIEPGDLHNNMIQPSDLTDRQREVADMVSRYVAVAGEMPSAGWLARRLQISRQAAREHLQCLRAKQWFGPYRSR